MSEEVPVLPADYPWIAVEQDDARRKLALGISHRLSRDARLAVRDGALQFAVKPKVAARLVQFGNKANAKLPQRGYLLECQAGGTLTLLIDCTGSDLPEGCEFALALYGEAGAFVVEHRWPLRAEVAQHGVSIPDEVTHAAIAIVLAGEGTIRRPILAVLGDATLIDPDPERVEEPAAAPAGEGDEASTAEGEAEGEVRRGGRSALAHGRVETDVGRLSVLYRNGFHTRAAEELARFVFDLHSSPRKRANAAFSLAASWLMSPSPETGVKVREMLEIIDAIDRPDWMGVERAIFKAEALAMAGDRAGARIAAIGTGARSRSRAKFQIEPALANAVDPPFRDRVILDLLNRSFDRAGCAPVALRDPAAPLSPANLRCLLPPAEAPVEESFGAPPLVSVIVPAFNAADRIATCLRSLLDQTWPALEIIVADDASTDETAAIVERFAAADPRVSLIRQPRNGGPYLARNAALAQAAGEYVTTHDADDWSHAQKIEQQVRHLIETPAAMGNMTQYLRFNDEFVFQRRGRLFYLGPCLSSFMFRRQPVTDALGAWDAVRFGGDAEFIARVELAFGPESVARLQPAMLTLMHLGDDNLTALPFSQYSGFKIGARKEYAEAAAYWYREAESLRIDPDAPTRPFPIPRIMAPDYRGDAGPDRLDLILASDFRLTGGTNQSNAQEIRIARELGLRVGLLQLDRYDVQPDAAIGDRIRALADGAGCRVVTYGETVACDLLMVRHPPVLANANAFMPAVHAKAAMVIVNEPPNRVRDGKLLQMYDPAVCEANLRRFATIAGDTAWLPIGPVVRDAFTAAHPDFPLSPETWLNILDFADWEPRPLPTAEDHHRKPIVGRHSRDHYTKWPERADALAAAYVSDAFDTHIMGGADLPAAILGAPPAGWTVHPFDAMPVADFLHGLDLFVYFTHSAWDEAFGRVILEALSVGLPVIAEPKLRSLFGEALIYAEPHEVPAVVAALWADPDEYARRARAGAAFARARFGPEIHKQRLLALLDPLRAA